MTAMTILMLLAAGILGGVANVMAGGASLVTFPALLAAGLPPIVANASNALAVVFGNITGVLTEREQAPVIDSSLFVTFAVAIIGGGIGAVLLLNTPESIFTMIVPALIGGATVIFTFAKSIQGWVKKQFGSNSNGVRTGLVFPAAVYGGYFGAGLGVIFMSVLSATSSWELRTTNSVKNMLGVLANVAAIIIFITQSVISWPHALTMMGGCILGGFIGSKMLRVIPTSTVRKTIIAVGAAMSLYYGWLYWF